MSAHTRTVVAITALLAAIMLASFTPTPLFPAYRDAWDLTDSDISLVFSGHPIGVLVVLLTLGGLSDRIGRVPTLRLGAALLLIAMALMASAGSLSMLFSGRMLQGIATGFITGAAAAALMDLHPRGPGAGSALNTLALGLGVSIGPVVSGQIASHLPGPLVAPYVVVIAFALIPLALLLARDPLPKPLRSGAERRPWTIRVPRAVRRPLGLAALSISTTNLTFALIGAFGPEIVESTGSSTPARVGGYVTAVLAIVALTQLAARRWALVPSMLTGAVTTAVGWGAATLATWTGSTALTIATIPLLGLGAGLGMFASAAHVSEAAPVHQRAEVYSAYLTAAFAALAAAALGIGSLVESHDIVTAAAVAAGTAVVLTIAMVAALPRPTRYV